VTNYLSRGWTVTDTKAAADEIGRLYPAVYRRFHVSRRPVDGSDLTPRMLGVLHHLSAGGPLTVGELATHLGLSKATATELVTRVQERGLVDRMRDERDQRRVYLWLTDRGRQRADAHARVLADDELLAAVGRMTPADRASLINGLRALLAAAEEKEPDNDNPDL
jgi:DNA-binding MarR family transcriptional regulator